MARLTPEQALAAIEDFHREHSYYPSRRELGGRLGVSHATANRLIMKLRKRSVIEVVSGISRGMRVTTRTT